MVSGTLQFPAKLENIVFLSHLRHLTRGAPMNNRSCRKRRCEENGEAAFNGVDAHDAPKSASAALPFVDFEEELKKKISPGFVDKVLEVYREVRRDYERMVQKEGTEQWNNYVKSRERPSDVPERSAGNLQAFVKRVKQEATNLNETECSVNPSTHETFRCQHFYLPRVQALPPMQYWTHTDMNIHAEDERTLSHIPYMDETVISNNFGDELLETFEEGIHGIRENYGYINDWIVHHVVQHVLNKYPGTRILDVFMAIHQEFPNKGSVRNLYGAYTDVRVRFDPSAALMHSAPYLKPENANLDWSSMAAEVLNSFEMLACPRCLVYDCEIHAADNCDARFSTRKRIKCKATTGCDNNCYLQHRTDQNSSDVVKELSVEIAEPHREFSVKTKACISILRHAFNDDYCRITDVINKSSSVSAPYTCRDVQWYCMKSSPVSPRGDLLSPHKKKKSAAQQHRIFRAVKWSTDQGEVKNKKPYRACNHPGPCSKENQCPCVAVDNLCTKYCGCGVGCKYLFPGCRCAPGNCRTKQCQCFYASWECDPDICKSCQCGGEGDNICKNVSIQRGIQKRLVIAPSQVAGWGCFAADPIEKNDFISEYCGELISSQESERRGIIYDKVKTSYLFGLNDEQTVDATRKGNLIRFANHSKFPNCRTKVMVVNGDHKIGIFALRNIQMGEELFFDYSYNKNQIVEFVSKELTRS